MSLNSAQTSKLFQLAKEFGTTIEWVQPLESEREPDYTARVLAPALRSTVSRLRHPGLVVRADGNIQAQAVMLGTSRHYPDMAVNLHHERVGAFEVKFIDEQLSGQSYLTAIGQAVAYASLGYAWALVIFVGKSKFAAIDPAVISTINKKLVNSSIFIIQVICSEQKLEFKSNALV